MAQLGINENIEILARSTIIEATQDRRGLRVRIRTRPRFVIPEKCIGCGCCEEVCPKIVTNATSKHDTTRKAIYLPAPQGIPPGYVIDEKACLFFNNQACGLCQEACPRQAVDLSQEPREFEIRVQAAILAPGAEPFHPAGLSSYGYGRYADVITTLEMEGMLSPSGPTKGELLRPSDGRVPRRIAWIQCIGSRQQDRPYCSSVCCMAAVKQAFSIRQALQPAPDTHIFYMDIRAHQKWAERYLRRAQDQGVQLRPSRVHLVSQAGDGSLRLRVWQGSGLGARDETFDMVVLSVGLAPSPAASRLMNTFGIETNRFGFVASEGFLRIATNRPMIFAAGCCCDPKSIQGAVIEGSASAALLTSRLGMDIKESAAQGSSKKQGRPSGSIRRKRAQEAEGQRVGVFICKCGRNIDTILDVQELVRQAKQMERVAMAMAVTFACAPDALKELTKTIAEKGLDRVVIAACSPKSHEQLFRQAMRDAGLNEHLLEIANIREQAAWVHEDDPDGAQARAADQIRMAVAKAGHLKPFQEESFPVKKRALVVGGGISGMTAAALMADRGVPVTLVERSASLGGNARMLLRSWRGLETRKHLKELTSKVQADKNIEIHLNSVVTKSKGETGDFTTFIKDQKEGTVRAVNHGAVVIATGAREARPSEYCYGLHPDIITHQELDERLMQRSPQGIMGLSSGSGCVVFIQCVGSCSKERPYCSRVCCTHSVNRAMLLKEQMPHLEIYILYRHMRTYGQRDTFYTRARSMGIKAVRFSDDSPPSVRLVTALDEDARPVSKIRIEMADQLTGSRLVLAPQLLVLASAIEPEMESNRQLSRIFKIPLGPDGFFNEAHTKLRPAELKRDGFFVAGLAHHPKEVEESISQAAAAAGKAAQFLSQDSVTPDRITAELLEHRCDGCALCLDVCHEEAITLVEYAHRGEIKKIVEIDSSLCSGCGACQGACPQFAVGIPGFMPEAMMKQIEAVIQDG